MELDSTVFDNVTFDYVNTEQNRIYCKIDKRDTVWFTSKGCINLAPSAKCVIFPKGKTTWEGFVPPCKFKDGDIVHIKTKGHNHNEFIIIFKDTKNDHIHPYACFEYRQLTIDGCAICHLVDVEIMRLATEEEKQKLFKAINDIGYKWNTETKTLEKLIIPKFKVGDRIKEKKAYISGIITDISDGSYKVEYKGGGVAYANIEFQDEWELVPKFNITDLKEFESRVLVRTTDDDIWRPAIYGFTDSNKYYIVGGIYWKQCIPYEVNKELRGTTNDCSDYFKTWE